MYVVQIFAVVLLATLWFLADGYSRRMRRRANRVRNQWREPVVHSTGLDPNTLSATDD